MVLDSSSFGTAWTVDWTVECTAAVEGLASSAPAPAAFAGSAATRETNAAGTAGAAVGSNTFLTKHSLAYPCRHAACPLAMALVLFPIHMQSKSDVRRKVWRWPGLSLACQICTDAQPHLHSVETACERYIQPRQIVELLCDWIVAELTADVRCWSYY